MEKISVNVYKEGLDVLIALFVETLQDEAKTEIGKDKKPATKALEFYHTLDRNTLNEIVIATMMRQAITKKLFQKYGYSK